MIYYILFSAIATSLRQSCTKKKPYKSNVCKQRFNLIRYFMEHKRTHTGKKSYKCNLCEKSFVQPGYLKIHMRSHTGEKPYKCDDCEKSFASNLQLRIHQRVEVILGNTKQNVNTEKR